MDGAVAQRVGLVLVSHDGARWLPTVLEGISSQTRPPEVLMGVDTGSLDGSADLVRDAFGSVQTLPSMTTFPAAVVAGVTALPSDVDWLWLLHDDSTPAPGALAALLEVAASRPEAAIIGPKLREWPSLRRLLEVGVTLSGTGRRETGLERGEYDQGQHDSVREVLAVHSAGMLIRRSAFVELGGFDDALPIFGNDLDLGWRAARAGMTTVVAPSAVVFHAEAAHRGVRRTALTGRHTHYQERRAALFTLFAHVSARSLPFHWIRICFGSLMRIIGLSLIRQVGQALDELAALLNVVARPGAVRAARRQRAALTGGDAAHVRSLLPPWWLPYRHALDVVSDIADAITTSAADVAERRRLAAAAADPSSFAARGREVDALDPEDEEMLRDSGMVARFLTNPIAVLLALSTLVLLVATRVAWGTVVGGGLASPPDSVGSWWSLALSPWHQIGQGTGVPAPPYVVPMALLASVLGGSPTLAVSVVMVASPLVALWGAWRLLRVLGRLLAVTGVSRWLLLWGSLTWSVMPFVSGAFFDGRLGIVVASALLPWLAHAALGFADPDQDRRWRAGWRTGLLLTLTVCFTPVAWMLWLSAAVVVVIVALALLRMRPTPSLWGPPLVSLVVPVVVLSPWWVASLLNNASAGLLLDAGRPPAPLVDGWGLAVGRIGELGAPHWWAGVLPALAVAALIPARTRVPVLLCWVLATVAASVAFGLSFVTLHDGGRATPVGTGFVLVLLQGCAVVAVMVGAHGVVTSRGPLSQWLVGGFILAAGLPLLASAGWALNAGLSPDAGSVRDTEARVIPTYMLEDAQRGAGHGILVLRGSAVAGIRFEVVRGEGLTIGQDEILALSRPSSEFSALIQDFVSRPSDATVAELARDGIQYVVAPEPADPAVAATIDATGGLSQASTESRSTRAWQVDAKPSSARLDGPGGIGDLVHWLLIFVQFAAAIVAAVQAAPTVRRSR